MKQLIKGSILMLLILIPYVCFSQEPGIQFTRNLSWSQMLAKAKAENKYLFVDCYASWCGPCKQMDADVYPQPNVGTYMNDHFICVRFQMDSTGHDPEEITNSYADAKFIAKTYHISAFPSFLYFSPEGSFVTYAFGYHDSADFLELARNCLDPNKQYYTQLNKYGKEVLPDSIISMLMQQSQVLGDTVLYHRLVRNYFNQQLLGFKSFKILNKRRMDFIMNCANSGLLSEKDVVDIFKLYNSNRVKFKEVTGDTPDRFLRYLILTKEVNPFVVSASKSPTGVPPWENIRNTISHKYNPNFAGQPILEAKVQWYGYKKNWKLYTHYAFQLVQKYGQKMGDGDVNNYAWKVFQYSLDKMELKAAIKWSKKVLERDPKNPEAMDTYSNLLYKIGRKKEALKIEASAAISADPGIKENFQKMQAGKSTWIEPKSKG